MIRAGRAAEGITTAARCLLALMGVESPTPEQDAGAHLLAIGLHDLRMTARQRAEE